MFCENCGKEIGNDVKFCPACGAALEEEVMEAASEEVAENPQQEVEEVTPAAEPTPAAPTKPEKAAKKSLGLPKKALVGIAGPWISGGIEFNWPQHHRPTTYMPLEAVIEENSDGGKTVCIGA